MPGTARRAPVAEPVFVIAEAGVNHNGDLALGTFQSIIAAELDGPRSRALHVQVLGY